jgi:hypothetical protein
MESTEDFDAALAELLDGADAADTEATDGGAAGGNAVDGDDDPGATPRDPQDPSPR